MLIDYGGSYATRTRRLRPVEDAPLFKEPGKSHITHIEVPESLRKAVKPKETQDPHWASVDAVILLLERGLITEIESEMILARIQS